MFGAQGEPRWRGRGLRRYTSAVDRHVDLSDMLQWNESKSHPGAEIPSHRPANEEQRHGEQLYGEIARDMEICARHGELHAAF
jgi:hypothetical protein